MIMVLKYVEDGVSLTSDSVIDSPPTQYPRGREHNSSSMTLVPQVSHFFRLLK